MLYDNFMKISIVTASYNYQDYIKDTIQSVLEQTYQDWELIIVDDCSTDNSVEVIKSFKDNRIKLLINEENKGLKFTLKRGIENASGEWIAILESDDAIREDYLEKKAAVAAKYPDTGLIFNDVEMFGDINRIKELEKTFSKKCDILKRKTYPCNLFKDLMYFNVILTFSAVLVNRDKILQCDFNTPTDKLLDWWLFLHFARNNDFYYIPEKLTKWRIHNDSYLYKKDKTYSYPVNLLAFIDIVKKEKNYKMAIIYTVPIVISTLYRLRVAICQHIKVILGIPLKGAKENT